MHPAPYPDHLQVTTAGSATNVFIILADLLFEEIETDESRTTNINISEVRQGAEGRSTLSENSVMNTS
ncbi:hypothetical protein GUJ93_ZPchr0008g11441 [Zizania palustris]|uniref:Uncharacterized protein n=1 Tax=Zizania palustris TaxID=103762 RepID=A0A8J5R0K1_ZIZPA|nr:hypothetical protein GUJ93_ZPchr0008g11441 [Zizania palustris]